VKHELSMRFCPAPGPNPNLLRCSMPRMKAGIPKIHVTADVAGGRIPPLPISRAHDRQNQSWPPVRRVIRTSRRRIAEVAGISDYHLP